MKTTYKYIALAAMAFSAVACSQEDLASSYLSDSKAVHISAQVGTSNNVTGGFQSRSNPLGSTAEEQAKFNKGDQISVAAGSQDAVTYTLGEDGSWMPETSKYLVWSSDNMNFTAYYPVGKNDASVTTFTVPSSYDSEADLANADYMTYSGNQSNVDGNGITLPMKRKMVRLVINTSFGNQYESGYEVRSIKIHTNSTGYAAKDQVQSGNKEVTAYKHSDGKFYALLAPTSEDASAAFLTVIVNGIAEELTVKGIPATIAGYSYELNLTVGKDKASVNSIEVSDWQKGEITGGAANEIAVVESSTHTIKTSAIGQLTNDLIIEALANGNVLKIMGPMGNSDFELLQNALSSASKSIAVNLSEVSNENVPDNVLYCGSDFQNASLTGDAFGKGSLAIYGEIDTYSKSKLKSVVGNESLTYVDMHNLNLKDVTGFYDFFSDTKSLTGVNLSGLDFSKVTTLQYCFKDTKIIENPLLNIKDKNLSSLTSMYGMFYKTAITGNLDFTGFKLGKIKDLGIMCLMCKNITGVSFKDCIFNDENNAVDCNQIFGSCYKLKSASFAGSRLKVKNAYQMFYNCYSLESIDFSSVDFTDCTNFSEMLRYCKALKEVKAVGCNETTITKLKQALSAAEISIELTTK